VREKRLGGGGLLREYDHRPKGRARKSASVGCEGGAGRGGREALYLGGPHGSDGVARPGGRGKALAQGDAEAVGVLTELKGQATAEGARHGARKSRGLRRGRITKKRAFLWLKKKERKYLKVCDGSIHANPSAAPATSKPIAGTEQIPTSILQPKPSANRQTYCCRLCAPG